MRRRFLLVTGFASLVCATFHKSKASEPDLIFVSPAAILLSFNLKYSARVSNEVVNGEALGGRLVKYLQSALEAASNKTPVADRSRFVWPEGIPTKYFLQVECRVDFESVESDSGSHPVIGAVSILLRSGPDANLSSEPFEFFELGVDSSSWTDEIEDAAQRALNNSVIEPLVSANK